MAKTKIKQMPKIKIREVQIKIQPKQQPKYIPKKSRTA